MYIIHRYYLTVNGGRIAAANSTPWFITSDEMLKAFIEAALEKEGLIRVSDHLFFDKNSYAYTEIEKLSLPNHIKDNA